MTSLQLENSEIIVGVDFTNNVRVNDILSQENGSSFLLYPGKESFNLSTNQSADINALLGNNAKLFILDGTWPCARKMLKLSKNLQQLKRVSFDNTITSKFLFKQQPKPNCLSTIESVYTVLNLLNQSKLEHCNTRDFLLPFEEMIVQQVEYLEDSTRNLLPKNKYKNCVSRNIVFEL